LEETPLAPTPWYRKGPLAGSTALPPIPSGGLHATGLHPHPRGKAGNGLGWLHDTGSACGQRKIRQRVVMWWPTALRVGRLSGLTLCSLVGTRGRHGLGRIDAHSGKPPPRRSRL